LASSPRSRTFGADNPKEYEMAVATAERDVTLTIPAEYLDDFRCAVVHDIGQDADWVCGQHKELVDGIDSGKGEGVHRDDLDGAVRSLREMVRLLDQLPDEDVEVSVSAETSALRFALDAMGRQLTKRIAGLYGYGPALVEPVPGLLERLRWAAVQANMIGGC
jgi:hypothetical protein